MMGRSVCFRAFTLSCWAVIGMVGPALASTDVHELQSGQWSGGGGVGFLGRTPDGVAEFAVNGHADYFLTHGISVGPLAQYAGVGNDILFGLSAQIKYWWDISAGANRVKLVAQGGFGFVPAGIEDSDGSGTADTYGSFFIPIGVGIDYAVSKDVAVTADVLLNITSLGATVRASGREFDHHTNVMPGLFVGVRI